MTALDDLKGQLARLDELIRTGVLTGDAAKAARTKLEAEVLALVVNPKAQAGKAAAAAGADRVEAAEPPARPSGRLLTGLVVFALVFTAAGYAWLGKPSALGVGPGQPGAAAADAQGQAPDRAQFEAMTARLAERLKTKPEDAEGWSMLGRSYSVLEQFPQALEAFKKVIELRPKDAQGYADYADAIGMANGRKLGPESEKLVNQALALDADNIKALSLLGTIAYERGDSKLAAQHWEHALAKAEPGSELAGRLRNAVDDARQRAGLPALPPPPPQALAVDPKAGSLPADAPASAAAPGPGVQVRISLAPALAAKAAPEDTVFIFARALQGPKAPLAIQRRQVKDLPLDLTLDDTMAMSPALRLSSVAQVIVGARVSKSGNPMPQPGDLQGLSTPVDVGTKGLQLQIGETLP